MVVAPRVGARGLAVAMVLITVRAVVGGQTLVKLARPIGDQETLDVTVNRVLNTLDAFELASVEFRVLG